MTDNINQESGLTELVKNIEEFEKEFLEKILVMAALKQEGSIDSLPYNYNFNPGLSTLIINGLAELLVSIVIKKDNKKEIETALAPLMNFIKPEINEIFAAIKKVGFSSNADATDENWRKAALNAFDNSKNKFQAIKREHLLDINLYAFSYGQEPRDFERRLLPKIILGLGLGDYKGTFLREIYRKHLST